MEEGREKSLAEQHNAMCSIRTCMSGASPFTAEDRARAIGPHAKEAGTLTEPRMFNLMFETHCGAVRDENSKAYLRPETAQGIFANFWNIVDTSRVKVPFGIAQIGKAFRNEINPRNFTFRSREFEQMEIEFFCHPETANEWYAFWRDYRFNWWKSIGLAARIFILREHERDELAHYSKAGHQRHRVPLPLHRPGFGELEGIAHRGNYDLTQHAKAARATRCATSTRNAANC